MNAYGLTATVEPRFHSAGGGSIVIEESFANQSSKVLDVRLSFRVSTSIHTASSRVLGERRTGSQISRAVDGIGRRNDKGVAIGGNTKDDLARRETGISPSFDGLGRGASLDVGTGVIQRSVGTDARVGSPLTLQNVIGYAPSVKRAGYIR
jgi:hypothetical protein